MKILFLPNWKVYKLKTDIQTLQAPDKIVEGQPYWFFKYFPENIVLDIIDISKSILSPLEKKVKFYILQAYKAFLKKNKYDIIISHGAQSGLVLSLFIALFCKKKPRHIIIDVGCMNGGRKGWALELIKKVLKKSKPEIIYHSSIQKEYYKKHFPFLKSQYIPFGVDADYFTSFNNQLNIHAPYILSFGYAKRDYPTLLKAWEKINTNVKLRLIGINLQKIGKINSNVEVYPKIGIKELMTQISNALFVVIPLPVYNYSYGQMSFLQSMAMGKPVIVTKTPSSADYLIDGQGTYYVKPYDINDLADKINFLLSEQDNLIQLGLLAQKQIKERLNEKIMAEKIYNFIFKNSNANPSLQ